MSVKRPPAAADRRHCQRLRRACDVLLEHYDTDGWWPARHRFEVIVGAILVQNTRWENAARAVRALRQARLLSIRAVLQASVESLAEVLRPAGCASVKVRRLRAVATGIRTSGGLIRMAALSTESLRQLVHSWHGVGDETADAILAFAFDRPVFVADAYARRWLHRMGVLDNVRVSSYARCQSLIADAYDDDPQRLRDLHAAIVRHARERCRHRPDCTDCCVRNQCKKTF